MKLKARKKKVSDCVFSCIGSYSVLKAEVIVNDDRKEYTDFEVVISNVTNENTISEIIRCHDSGVLSILVGEDSFSMIVDNSDFIMSLFLSSFLTLNEV